MVMNKKELVPGVVVYSNAMNYDGSLVFDIEEGISSAKIEWQLAGVKTGDEEAGKNKELRDTFVVPVPYSEEEIKEFIGFKGAFFSSLSNLFLENLGPLENDYKSMYGLSTTWHDQYSILKYGVGQKFVNHVDDHKDYHRRMSTIYYINDNYEGGEIVFPRFGITYKPAANDFLVFPSTYVYNHSVLPVKSGERYAVVSWLK
jgi:hypothetical protein